MKSESSNNRQKQNQSWKKFTDKQTNTYQQQN